MTLLGDAAQLMSPFAGEDANLAMFDGAELGKMIAAHANNGGMAPRRRYEKDLFPRSAAVAAETVRNMQVFVRPFRPEAGLSGTLDHP